MSDPPARPPAARFVLTDSQRDEIDKGRFVRVGAPFGGALVGMVDGAWRAYHNECKHRALPLDLGARSPMSDDGQYLLCHQHGALYRLDDGRCTLGPCAGESLVALSVREDGEALEIENVATVPRYPYVAVDVDEDAAEEAGARLFELGAGGVEQRDATTLVRSASAKVTLVAGFAERAEADEAAAALPAEWAPRVEEVVGDAWRDEWKKHFEPFAICAGVVIRPPWRTVDDPGERRVIVLEPGRAFGTGLHETTSLVAEVLAGTPLDGATVLDVGCGSGILSLVALALGARAARAIDVDPDAVAVTRENAARNGLQDRLVADEAPVGDVSGSFPVVLANIEAKTLVDLAPGLAPRVEEGGLLVLSGILAADVTNGQVEDVRKAYAGLKELAIHRKGEWVALVFSRAPAGSAA